MFRGFACSWKAWPLFAGPSELSAAHNGLLPFKGGLSTGQKRHGVYCTETSRYLAWCVVVQLTLCPSRAAASSSKDMLSGANVQFSANTHCSVHHERKRPADTLHMVCNNAANVLQNAVQDLRIGLTTCIVDALSVHALHNASGSVC